MIFYFTGTGNSLYIAKELDKEIISIPQVIKKSNITYTSEQIGVVCPIYGHEIPAMVKEFLKKVVLNTEYFYLVLTFGALHGGAAEIAEQYLESIGKKADYITTIMMVDNFLPNFDMNSQIQMDKKVDDNLKKIRDEIEKKTKNIQKASQRDKEVHKMYMSLVKNQPETIWADYKIMNECVGCGICMKVCPAGCIRIENQRAMHTKENCQACMACIHACPKMAMQMNIKEINPKARYRNEHISLSELVLANNQVDK